ncbi:MAG: hypothetical protein RJA98_2576 [Pseudomonadota bacterium]|jgi:hypothetical protein
MDREQKKGKFDWLPTQMPGVARLIKEARTTHGDAWVNECWKRGVIDREPGWFYAGEGALMVGTLWDDPLIIAFASAQYTKSQHLLVLRPKGVA